MKNALQFSHQLIASVLKDGDIAIDATAGNGHDTLFLAERVAPHGHVYAFDLQERAIQQTQEKLTTSPYRHLVTCIHASHADLTMYVESSCPIKAAMFNLGYLPGGDKTIITHAQTTIQALQQLMERLVINGRIAIAAYYGHAGGIEELTAIENFLQSLDQQTWTVLKYQFINQQQSPPICFGIERKQ